jgi:hypothetical protein
MEIHQMDVKTAFLNGELEEEIYMEQPQGFVHKGGEHLVCKLHKSLYGLKQSPRAWNQKLDAFLKSIEFMKSEADPSVYVAQVGDVKFFIVVYVDDLILVCNDQNKLLQIKEELRQKFEMKYLGELHFFLGMEVERNRDEQLVHINQIKYLKEILKHFRMKDCKPIGVPFYPKVKLQRNANGNCCNPTLAKCEDETHTPKVEDLESSRTPECLELNSKGQNTSPWDVLGVVEKVLKCRCPEWPRIGHLDICSPIYGQKKNRESNWQFDSRPLKVWNRPVPDVRWGSATRRWKALKEGYKFGLDLVPIGGQGEKL